MYQLIKATGHTTFCLATFMDHGMASATSAILGKSYKVKPLAKQTDSEEFTTQVWLDDLLNQCKRDYRNMSRKQKKVYLVKLRQCIGHEMMQRIEAAYLSRYGKPSRHALKGKQRLLLQEHEHRASDVLELMVQEITGGIAPQSYKQIVQGWAKIDPYASISNGKKSHTMWRERIQTANIEQRSRSSNMHTLQIELAKVANEIKF